MVMEYNLNYLTEYLGYCVMARGKEHGNRVSYYAKIWHVPRRREWSSRQRPKEDGLTHL